jgi:hypothetical protein
MITSPNKLLKHLAPQLSRYRDTKRLQSMVIEYIADKVLAKDPSGAHFHQSYIPILLDFLIRTLYHISGSVHYSVHDLYSYWRRLCYM